MGGTRHLFINDCTKAMLQFKEKPCLSEKGRARGLVIELSTRNFRSHEAHPLTVLILPCSLDVSDKFYQNHELT
jgi:hypothetical protein